MEFILSVLVWITPREVASAHDALDCVVTEEVEEGDLINVYVDRPSGAGRSHGNMPQRTETIAEISPPSTWQASGKCAGPQQRGTGASTDAGASPAIRLPYPCRDPRSIAQLSPPTDLKAAAREGQGGEIEMPSLTALEPHTNAVALSPRETNGATASDEAARQTERASEEQRLHVPNSESECEDGDVTAASQSPSSAIGDADIPRNERSGGVCGASAQGEAECSSGEARQALGGGESTGVEEKPEKQTQSSEPFGVALMQALQKSKAQGSGRPHCQGSVDFWPVPN